MDITSTLVETPNEDRMNKIYFIIYNLYALFFTCSMMYTSYHSMFMFSEIINTIKPKLNELECIIGIIFKELNINMTICTNS